MKDSTLLHKKHPGLKELLHIAIPMTISEGSEIVMRFVDRLFLSSLGKNYISAAMSGGLNSYVCILFFAGMIGYVNAITAQFYGAGKQKECSSIINQGFLLSIAVYPILLILIPLAHIFFVMAGHSPEQIFLEFIYFKILMYGSIVVLFRSALVGFFIGIGKTKIVMFANLLGMLVNIPLNYIFIFGKLGLPPLGMAGAALGTIVSSFISTSLVAIVYFGPKINRIFATRKFYIFNKKLMMKIIRFGLPSGIEIFLVVFAFNIFIQLMFGINENVAAAVTITFTWDNVSMVSLRGLGFATIALVGQQIGAKNYTGAEKVTILAFKASLINAFVVCGFFVFATSTLVGVFSSGFTTTDNEIVSLATTMLRLSAFYLIGDAAHMIFAGALRGAGDTKKVMYITSVFFWLIAGSAFFMIKIINTSPVCVWIVFVILSTILGVVFFVRYKSGKWKEITMI